MIKIADENRYIVKVDVSIDEKWPVFSLKEVSSQCRWTVEIPEDMYREYLWVMYKYHEIQTKLQVYYEQCQRAEIEPTQEFVRTNM